MKILIRTLSAVALAAALALGMTACDKDIEPGGENTTGEGDTPGTDPSQPGEYLLPLPEQDLIPNPASLDDLVVPKPDDTIIVGTERGILYEMRQANPGKRFIPVSSPDGQPCECGYMKQNTLENLYLCLRDETPEITMSADIIERAKKPIVRMLEMSKQLGIIK